MQQAEGVNNEEAVHRKHVKLRHQALVHDAQTTRVDGLEHHHDMQGDWVREIFDGADEIGEAQGERGTREFVREDLVLEVARDGRHLGHAVEAHTPVLVGKRRLDFVN